MNGYKDLQVYQESKRLAVEVHRMSMNLPKHEMFEEGSQIRRSSKAVTSLIIEGFGRRKYNADYVRYLILSHAECDETILHLEFLYDCKSLQDETIYRTLKSAYVELSRKIYGFLNWVEDNG